MIAALVAGLAVAGCGGNPLGNKPECGGNPLPGGPGCTPGGGLLPGADSEVTPLPGTTAPSASKSILRYEDLDTGTGNGYAQGFVYNPLSNTYTIDNLAFDGANNYRKRPGQPVDTLGGYQVYEASATELDPQTGVPIPQFQHRLLAGISATGRTEFAIVRTGAYRGYGFGGFVLKRTGGVVLPTTQQAAYSGNYAAIRDFSGASGLEYATGTMEIAIDFEDFNAGDAVRGSVSNRQIFDVNGNNITATVLAAMDAKFNPSAIGPGSTQLPTLVFKVGPGAIDANGEIRGLLDSAVLDRRTVMPTVTTYETGTYYAVVSGSNADEVVGVIVVEAEDPRLGGVKVRETGGFILYRP
ncbi:MAG: hypothetical protein ACK4RZ_07400 [Paracoccaceae bacterium]